MYIQSATDNRCYFSGYRSIVYDRVNSIGTGPDFVGQERVVHRSLVALIAGEEGVRFSLLLEARVTKIVGVYKQVDPETTLAFLASYEVFCRNHNRFCLTPCIRL